MKTTDVASRAAPVHQPCIRTADRDDVVEAAQTYQAAARELGQRLRNDNPWASESARNHDLRAAITLLSDTLRDDPESVVVAERDGQIVGVASIRVQDRHAHIQFLFVNPEVQGGGIGKALLHQLREHADRKGAEVISLTASRDPRAWQRYLALGLRPAPPTVCLRATDPRFPIDVTDVDLTERPINLHDTNSLAAVDAIDAVVRGSRRHADLERWLAGSTSGALVYRTAREPPIGYFMITDSATYRGIGPVASLELDDVPPVLDRALVKAGSLLAKPDIPWRVDLPGANHAVIGPLLAVGFRPSGLLHWFETESIGQWDRYIFRDEDAL